MPRLNLTNSRRPHGRPCRTADSSDGHSPEDHHQEMNKKELLREAAAKNLSVNPRWLVGEIRSVINEHRQSFECEKNKASVPKGPNKMTLDELRETAPSAEGHERTHHEAHSGQCRGSQGDDHDLRTLPGEDLRMFANWARENLTEPAKSAYATRPDPEEYASVPYTPEGCHGTCCPRRSPRQRKRQGQQFTPPRGTTRGPSAMSSANSDLSSMQHEPDKDVVDEIHHLKTRLARLATLRD